MWLPHITEATAAQQPCRQIPMDLNPTNKLPPCSPPTTTYVIGASMTADICIGEDERRSAWRRVTCGAGRSASAGARERRRRDCIVSTRSDDDRRSTLML